MPVSKDTRKAKALEDILRRVSVVETLDEVLEQLVDVTTLHLEAERGTIFLNDEETSELIARVAQGSMRREIRILNNSGIAGSVFTMKQPLVVDDAQADERFNSAVDEQTGFVTRSIMAAPIRTVKGHVIGVAQVLNKRKGKFSKLDQEILEAMMQQVAIALRNAQTIERVQKAREQEREFLDVVAELTAEIDLNVLLQKVMSEATSMLNAERSTLFLNDDKTNELFSRVAQGDDVGEIRLPNHLGIAGAVFTSQESVNIPHAYADLRFNPAFDKKTGFFTRSILCVPVMNKRGKNIGVTQVLNKRGGPFTEEDEQRLKAFNSQVAIALENAKLFDDVQSIKNYNESMLQSMSNGVLTLDENGGIVTCNAAGLRILKHRAEEIIGFKGPEIFTGPNRWIMEKVERVSETQETDISMDAEMEWRGQKVSTNFTALPLVTGENKALGTLIMLEDISAEKRVKSTMSRYMDPGLADKLLESGEDLLGGQNSKATMLFTDIKSFTTLSEELGPQATVSLLNEYFTIMVECVSQEGGMLDKYIGDAIMAEFGIPLPHDDDEDRALRTGIAMQSQLGDWNANRRAHGQPEVGMRVGINTDVVVSGNIGSPKRMDYTVIGDGVNLASRLEAACKQYGAHILISENTRSALRGTYRMREVDLLVVKGKTQPVPVFEVLDYYKDNEFPNMMDVMGHFQEGINHFRAAEWDRAITKFNEALKANPNDACSKMYIERCEHLKEAPPAGEWNGVWVMTTK
ncbi:GAF domain-containing protein [Magnetospira sp. QH-2]|uniref:GAF domain-containing protein n=1 Tax=Magnetospira sp. (strain QH-2) TaxID=1288970 RepID=UPI0003E817D5|nr:GAF domain-containing protein [Magnetospira sp. QH-2]CCQ73276.1 Conserved protein of unknown function. Containing adenylate/guanylate cyclase domain [Magnetospira sp. QH-2]